MRYTSIATAAICLIAIAACKSSKETSATKKLPGTWQDQPVTIDGDSKEWPSPYPNYDSKALIAYATSNDKENLYVTVETGDEITQMKLLRTGLTVFIDTSGKKEQVMAIHYPLANEEVQIDLHTKGQGQGDAPAVRNMTPRVQKGIGAATQITLEGWPTGNGGYLVTQHNPCGITVRMALDEYKELVWEAVIPFKAIYNKTELSKKDLGRPISVCFAIKGMKKASSPSGSDGNSNGGRMGGGGGGMGGGSGMSGMGGGGMGGGGMHGGGGHGGRGGSHGASNSTADYLIESTKTWKQFGLAYQ
jgi:hypothetical protein